MSRLAREDPERMQEIARLPDAKQRQEAMAEWAAAAAGDPRPRAARERLDGRSPTILEIEATGDRVVVVTVATALPNRAAGIDQMRVVYELHEFTSGTRYWTRTDLDSSDPRGGMAVDPVLAAWLDDQARAASYGRREDGGRL